jgi:hypothetical protein
MGKDISRKVLNGILGFVGMRILEVVLGWEREEG